MAHDSAIRGSALPAALCVSAPGKVLLTGGYLILEERFAGLVVATTARFHSSISHKPSLEATITTDNALLAIRVESPQFDQVVRAHVVRHGGEVDGHLVLRMSEDSDRNGYVEETLVCALNGILGVDAPSFLGVCDALRSNGEELHIRLEADNAFYSQVERLKQSGKSLSRRHLEELPAFLPPFRETVDGKSSSSIAKTGLGSSAALVTSLVGALVQFFMDGDLSDERRDLIHNLAQLSHCFVQRKIGSGFDVSSACYGTQRYARFSPSVLDKFTNADNLIPSAIAQCVVDTNEWKRSERVMTFSLPSNLRLFMGDVSTGSATVSMVKKVLAWQKSTPVVAERVVGALASHNLAVEQSFRRLDALASGVSGDGSERFAQKCSEMALVSAEQWKFVDPVIGEELCALRNQYQSVRRCFREMGELAGVPIEPTEQTALLDATMEIPGVLIAGVPGAGGYDAIFVLTLNAVSLDRVEKLWLDWPQTHPGAVSAVGCVKSHRKQEEPRKSFAQHQKRTSASTMMRLSSLLRASSSHAAHAHARHAAGAALSASGLQHIAAFSSQSHLSAMRFADLSITENSKRAIRQELKYEYLTDVQEKTFSHIMEGKDVLSKAKTGNGKTMAFLLPTIERMMRLGAAKTPNTIPLLVISPTRELAHQIAMEARKIGEFHNLNVACFVGGTSVRKDTAILAGGKPVDIVVATPGRLLDLIDQDAAHIKKMLRKLRFLVLDEADRLLDMGFRNEVMKILDNVPTQRQTLLFSATLPKSTQELTKLALNKDYELVNTVSESDDQTNVQVTQEYVVCPATEVVATMERVLASHIAQRPKDYKVIVFFPTARAAQFMAHLFIAAGFKGVLEMHSRKSQVVRTKTADKFRTSSRVMMFSSDVSARGVDYPDVSLVLQVGLTDRDQYIHRLGRTARGGSEGHGILVLADFEKPLMNELRDLPIKKFVSALDDENTESLTAKAIATLSRNSELEKSATQSYQAWLGFYHSNLRRLGINKEELVQLAEEYSRTIGLTEIPKLDLSILKKMGLAGVAGIEPAEFTPRRPRAPRGAPRDASPSRSMERSGDRSDDRPRERSGDRSFDHSFDRSRDRSRERSGGRSGERSFERSGDRSGGRSGERSFERSGDRSRERSRAPSAEWSDIKRPTRARSPRSPSRHSGGGSGRR